MFQSALTIRGFSDLLAATTARPLTDGESDWLVTLGLGLERRLAAARALEEREVAIATWAADAFCDARPKFQAPAGSPRHQKGYRDGRLMVRYLATAIREGSFAPLNEKVLSWYVGHLEEESVQGNDIEVFIRFIGQAARQELPLEVWPLVQELIEPAVAVCRHAGISASLRAKYRRIADSSVRRTLKITPDFETRHGNAALAKGKRDIELFVQEFAKLLHEPKISTIHAKVTAWLLETVVPFVEASPDTWQWQFLSLREAIVERCGPAAGRRAGQILERLADNAERIVNAAGTYRVAALIGELGAAGALRNIQSPGFDTERELKPALTQANKQLVCSLLTLYAAGGFEQHPERLVAIWRSEYQPALPIRTPEMQVYALQSLLAAAQQKAPGLGVQIIQAGLSALAETAKRCAAAERIGGTATEAIDQAMIVGQAKIAAVSQASPATRRDLALDLRLLLARSLQCVALGSHEDQTLRLRLWVAQTLAPRWAQFSWDASGELLQHMIRSLTSANLPQDMSLVQPWLEEAVRQLVECRKVQHLGEDFASASQVAAEKAYAQFPDHPSASTGGLAQAARDGRLLLEQVQLTLALGTAAEPQLHIWFQEEIVARSGIGGRMLNEFLGTLKEGVADANVQRLVNALISRAPSYAAAFALEQQSDAIARKATEQVMARLPDYRQQVGEGGQQSAVRDNASTLRGLALYLLQPKDSTLDFQGWWQGRIGRYIVTRPAQLFSTNLEELERTIKEHVDSLEAAPAVGLLRAAYQGLV